VRPDTIDAPGARFTSKDRSVVPVGLFNAFTKALASSRLWRTAPAVERTRRDQSRRSSNGGGLVQRGPPSKRT
jgi:hypothetical protein